MTSALGAFLKARRDQLRPDEVGLRLTGARRRVPGLRREELASLAGISPDYYVQLEQGRGARPSPQVLDALADALRLAPSARAHLRTLALGAPTGVSEESLAPELTPFVDQLAVPAFVVGRYFDCLASNPLARALSPNFVPGRNLLRQLFLDADERRLHADWEEATAGVVGGLRANVGAAPPDARVAALIEELSTNSDRFRELWKRAEVGCRPAGTSLMLHPVLGELELYRRRLVVPGSQGQHVQLYWAAPDTDSARKLGMLSTL